MVFSGFLLALKMRRDANALQQLLQQETCDADDDVPNAVDFE